MLGHVKRAEVGRPREQLALPESWEAQEAEEDASLFSTRLWAVRRAVQNGHAALHTVLTLTLT